MTTWDRPIPFDGPPEQRAINRASHAWIRPAPDETPECMDCMAKSWHAAADYPCGVEPPREQVELPPTGVPTTHPRPTPVRPRRDLDD